MTEIIGKKRMTIEVSGGGTYCLNYKAPGYLCIYNTTIGKLLIGDRDSFESENGVGEYITLPEGSSVSEYRHSGKIYLKALASGSVVIGKE